MEEIELTILFDGGCPLCLREVKFLRSRDNAKSISFVDIDSPDYNPGSYGGITYREAMGRIHALNEDGEILKDIKVFREAYNLIGLGWVYAPTKWPGLELFFNWLYRAWSDRRLQFTRRPSLNELCKCRESEF